MCGGHAVVRRLHRLPEPGAGRVDCGPRDGAARIARPDEQQVVGAGAARVHRRRDSARRRVRQFRGRVDLPGARRRAAARRRGALGDDEARATAAGARDRAALRAGVGVRGVAPRRGGVAGAFKGSLSGETAALVLSALACVTLGVLLAAVVAPRWLRWGVYAMAAVDTVLVVTDLLQGPNSTLVAAGPTAGLPRLQAVYFGSATMGFGDLFIAATVGALLASQRRSQLEAALLAAILGLGFDLLFFAVDLLPTTVPIAVTLALLEARDRRRAARAAERRGQPSLRPVPLPRTGSGSFG